MIDHVNQKHTDTRINIQLFYNYLGVNDTFVPNAFTDVVNKSFSDQKVSPEIIEHLNNYYKPFNSDLELFLGRNPF